jgi:hypothetical protein
MVIRQIIGCDLCSAEPADRIPVGVGNEAMTIDLCQGCQDALQLTRLRALLTEYGVVPKPDLALQPGRVKPLERGSAPGSWQCPRCGGASGKRRDAIVHCIKVHGMDLAEASHAIPPVGEGEECQVCGYLAQNTTGVLSHLRSAHPQAPTEQRAVEERAVEERAVEERVSVST